MSPSKLKKAESSEEEEDEQEEEKDEETEEGKEAPVDALSEDSQEEVKVPPEFKNEKLVPELGKTVLTGQSPEELGEHLISLFEGELRAKRIAAFNALPIEEGELPQEIPPEYKLVLVQSYFEGTGDKIRFPKLLKQLKTEDDMAYEARVKNYLLCLDDLNFTKTFNLIDTQDPRQKEFFELYNEISEQREGKNERAACSIF